MYFSYYSGGFRVAQIEDDETGHYIDPAGGNLLGRGDVPERLRRVRRGQRPRPRSLDFRYDP